VVHLLHILNHILTGIFVQLVCCFVIIELAFSARWYVWFYLLDNIGNSSYISLHPECEWLIPIHSQASHSHPVNHDGYLSPGGRSCYPFSVIPSKGIHTACPKLVCMLFPSYTFKCSCLLIDGFTTPVCEWTPNISCFMQHLICLHFLLGSKLS
jgi:hypothetical protein